MGPEEAGFVEVDPGSLAINPFTSVGSDWMLVTAADGRGWNTMTAGWGGLGYLWRRNVCFAFVRPQRHTFGFMERAAGFTLSFFGPGHRAALEFCGSHSGRDVDKAAATGLEPFEPGPGLVSFSQASLVLAARKIYAGDIDPALFADASIEELYPARDYHRMYIGEITRALGRG